MSFYVCSHILQLLIIFSTVDYSKLSGGTRPNLAYGAGSTWLQGTNNDAVYEEAGRCSYILCKNTLIVHAVQIGRGCHWQ